MVKLVAFFVGKEMPHLTQIVLLSVIHSIPSLSYEHEANWNLIRRINQTWWHDNVIYVFLSSKRRE